MAASKGKSKKSKGKRELIRLITKDETGKITHTYYVKINRQNMQQAEESKFIKNGKLRLRKYCPVQRKTVWFTQAKMPSPKKK